MVGQAMARWQMAGEWDWTAASDILRIAVVVRQISPAS